MKMELDWLNNLQREVEAGNIRIGKDTNRPLKIYNYTQKAQFSQHWNDITLTCRGLILDNDGKVVVLPPKKFFNQNEPLAAKVNLKTARISEKLDGMMIILKIDPDWGLIVTSRGSFDNKYTDAARKFITDDILLELVPNYSYFCELCQNFPGDESIILTQHLVPKLICWAIRDENFNEIVPDGECPFPIAKELSLPEAKEYLTQKVEGIVAQDLKTGERVKLKTSWFLEHHRLIAHCTKKRVWDLLILKYRDGIPYDLNTLDIPDEFMQMMKNWESELLEGLESWLGYYKTLNWILHLSDRELAKTNLISKKDIHRLLSLRHKKKGFKSIEYQILLDLKPENDIIEG